MKFANGYTVIMEHEFGTTYASAFNPEGVMCDRRQFKQTTPHAQVALLKFLEIYSDESTEKVAA